MVQTCRPHSFLDRVACVLIYPSTFDIVLNYLLLIINVAFCTFEVQHQTRYSIQKYSAFGSFLFVVVFQITLCLNVGCYGISIVWCAMLGWIISKQRRMTQDQNNNQEHSFSEIIDRAKKWGRTIILFDLSGIVYYAIIAEAITTIAHLCALILGALLELVSEIVIRFADETEGTSSEEEPINQ